MGDCFRGECTKLNKGLKGCGLLNEQHMCWKGFSHFKWSWGQIYMQYVSFEYDQLKSQS